MKRGFTQIELLVIISMVAIFIVLGFPALARAKAKARRIGCVSRLKNIGLGERIFATDNHDLFSWQRTNKLGQIQIDYAGDVLKHFLAISNELSTPVILACPADVRLSAKTWSSLTFTNISYFIGLEAAETYPNSLMGGDRNLTTNGVRLPGGLVKIEPGAKVAWDGSQHQFQGNAVMGDGSVQQLSSARLAEQLKNAGKTNITLAVP